MVLVDMLNLIAGAVFAGAFFWLLMWPLTWLAQRLRFKPAFAEQMLNGTAEEARYQLRTCVRSLWMLVDAPLAAVSAMLVLRLFGTLGSFGAFSYALFTVACLLIIVWGVFLVRGLRGWRNIRFAVCADAAIGAALARLALQGHRIFHNVSIGGILIEHVVAGPRGVFAVKVIARRSVKGRNVVRLSERALVFQDGAALLDPIPDVERAARLLGEIIGRVLSHPVTVRPVLATPGWTVAPAQTGDMLLVNEKNAVMLPSWDRPADHLLSEDISALQERLTRLCSNRHL